MTSKIHIVQNNKGELEIVDQSRLRIINPNYKVQPILYKISKRYYDEDGEPCHYDVYVKINHSFTVI